MKKEITVKQALAYITGDTLTEQDKITISEYRIESCKKMIKEEQLIIKQIKKYGK